jgi:regulator of sigma E protease
MEGMIMTAQILLSLSILIVLHEGGHFLAARAFKIRVEKFYLFFDFLFPMASVLNFSLLKFKKGDTEYGIGWFPLGGYVKIAGMVDESMDKEQLKAPPQPWEFRAKPAWQRLIVMLGGVLVNIFVGITIFIALTYFLGDTYIPKDFINAHGGIRVMSLGEKIGLQTGDKIIRINGRDFTDFSDITKPDVLLSQGSYYTVLRNGREEKITIPSDFIDNFNRKDAIGNFVQPRIPAIVAFIPDENEKTAKSTNAGKSIAQKIGLRVGDQIVEIDGEPVQYIDEVNKIVKGPAQDSIFLKIRRGGQILAFREDFRGRDGIGFAGTPLDKRDLAYVNYGLGESIGLGTERAVNVIFVQLKAFKKLFGGQMSFRKSLSGPIGMAQMYGGEWDWERFWRLTGLVSMLLAFTNLLPIPALDGGYVMFLLYEMITGREPSERFFENALKIGFAILIVLIFFTFYNDIAKHFTNS